MAAERVGDLGKNKLRKLLMNTVMINSAINFQPLSSSRGQSIIIISDVISLCLLSTLMITE